jgi:hypothetical protein
MLRNLGILKILLRHPTLSDQYKAGPGEVKRTSTATSSIGAAKTTVATVASDKSIIRFRCMSLVYIRDSSGQACLGCKTTRQKSVRYPVHLGYGFAGQAKATRSSHPRFAPHLAGITRLLHASGSSNLIWMAAVYAFDTCITKWCLSVFDWIPFRAKTRT